MATKYMIRWEEESEAHIAYFDNFGSADMICGLLTDAGSLAEVWQRVVKEENEEKEAEDKEEEAKSDDSEAEDETPVVTKRRWG